MGPYVTHPQNQSVNITGTFLCPTQTCTCHTLGPELTTAIVYHPRFTEMLSCLLCMLACNLKGMALCQALPIRWAIDMMCGDVLRWGSLNSLSCWCARSLLMFSLCCTSFCLCFGVGNLCRIQIVSQILFVLLNYTFLQRFCLAGTFLLCWTNLLVLAWFACPISFVSYIWDSLKFA